MDNSILVHIDDGLRNLLYLNCSLAFGQFFLFLQLGVKCAFLHVFQDQVDVLGVVEDSVDLKDVLMFQVGLKLHFEDELIDHHVIFQHFLRYLLQRVEASSLDVERLPDGPELAASEFRF